MLGCISSREKYKPENISEILTKYLIHESPKKSGHDVEKYILKSMLREDWALMPIEHVTAFHMSCYRDRRLKLLKASSFNRQFGVLKSACMVAKNEWCWGFRDDFLNIRRPKVDSQKIPRRVTSEEFEALIQACDSCSTDKMKHLLVLAIETAMRRGELCSLKRNSVDFRRGFIFLEETKTGFSRTIPMIVNAKHAAEALSYMSNSEELIGLTTNAVRMSFCRLRKRAGYPNIRFHDLRHEAISRLFEAGLTPPEVASISGHRTLSMLMRYSHASLDSIRQKLI